MKNPENNYIIEDLLSFMSHEPKILDINIMLLALKSINYEWYREKKYILNYSMT